MDEPEAIIVVEVRYLRGLEARVRELEDENANLHELFKELATIKDSEIIRAIVEKRALAAAEKPRFGV